MMLIAITGILFFYFIIVASKRSPCQLADKEYSVLQTFYNSTNGPSWKKRCQWDISQNSSYPCSNWYGITCDDTCSVSILALERCSLSGTITEQLSSLSRLQNILFQNNHLSMTIPTLYLPLLQSLELYFNSLTGTIPSLKYLSSLKTLELQHNGIFGPIPLDLTTINTLSFIDLDFNKLTGFLFIVYVPNMLLTNKYKN